jgi:hypothetical protein
LRLVVLLQLVLLHGKVPFLKGYYWHTGKIGEESSGYLLLLKKRQFLHVKYSLNGWVFMVVFRKGMNFHDHNRKVCQFGQTSYFNLPVVLLHLTLKLYAIKEHVICLTVASILLPIFFNSRRNVFMSVPLLRAHSFTKIQLVLAQMSSSPVIGLIMQNNKRSQ